MHRLNFTRENRVCLGNTSASVRSIAEDHGIVTNHPPIYDKFLHCRGNGLCRSCRVEIDDDVNVNRPTVFERLWRTLRLLGPKERLACQARVYGPIEVVTRTADPKALKA